MNLSVTTLASPDWDLATVISRYAEYGFRQLDFRGCAGELQLWKLPEFSRDLAETAGRIRDAGLTVTCVSTGIHTVGSGESRRSAIDEELVPTLTVCRALGAGQIRVFGGAFDEADTSRERAIEQVGANLRAIAGKAGDSGVDVLLETHDAWTRSEHSLAAVSAADRPNVGLCWDIKHTYWVADETPRATWRAIGARVRNTHWKDSRRGEDGRKDRLCLCGEGLVPLADAYQVLASAGYAGPCTLEWEKRWHPHIEEPEVALPHFIDYMQTLHARRERFVREDARLMSAS